jgi:hypothetical protein
LTRRRRNRTINKSASFIDTEKYNNELANNGFMITQNIKSSLKLPPIHNSVKKENNIDVLHSPIIEECNYENIKAQKETNLKGVKELLLSTYKRNKY